MKRFVCSVCGYVYEGEEAPKECPICHQPGEKFQETPARERGTVPGAKVSEIASENITDTSDASEKALSFDLNYNKSFISNKKLFLN